MAVDIPDLVDLAREMFPGQPKGFPFECNPEDVFLPDGDDMGIPSDDDDIDEGEVQTETGFGSVIVVSNLPKVGAEKYDKLATVIKKICGSCGTVREGGLYMPMDKETSATKGFAFIEYEMPETAKAAKGQINGYKLDKNHTLVCHLFDDFDKYSKVPDEYQEPEEKEYKPQENLQSWLMDKYGRDQFCIRHGDDTEVLWNDGKRFRQEEVYKRSFWTESYVQWSPHGNLLATVHRQGVAVWGGPSFTRLQRFSHPGVQFIEISPNEKYLVSYSSIEPQNPRDNVTVLLNVFDTRTGKKLRMFEGAMDEYAVGASAGAGGALKWPVFKWAGGRDDLYFARLGRNAISVYSCPDMVLLDKRSVKLDGVYDFEWSPSEPVIAAYTTEQGNLPARITLMKIPERTELRQKNLFSVSDVKIFWHPQGDYLAVKVDRFTKTKKSTYTGFELFSIRERDIPMEVLELANKNEKIVSFAWEPKGNRFAIVHGDGPRHNVSFYSMKDDKGRPVVKLLGTLSNRACNQIYWSPQGKNIVLAGLKNLNGMLEFFNVDEFETMATAEHFMATDVEWDPTGRYVASSVTSIQQMENGFNMWSFNGRLMYSMQRDRFFQFSWRPRMPSLLPSDKEAEILKNLKQYSKRYDEEDEALLMQADADVLQERKRLIDQWEDWQLSKQDWVEQLEEFKKEMLGDLYAEREYTMETATVEQILEVKEEAYNPASY